MSLNSRLVKQWSQLSWRKQNLALQNQVQSIRRSWEDFPYTDCPKVSMILQFFNKRPNIKKLIERLRHSGAEEIIIIDDGSIDGSYEDWMQYLNRPNDFLLRCNDLFEVRTYDRAIRMAKGEFVCLLQDDDILPANNIWVEQALTLFNLFPDLIMLGGRDGIDIMMPEPADPQSLQEYRQIGDLVECPGLKIFTNLITCSTKTLKEENSLFSSFCLAVNSCFFGFL